MWTYVAVINCFINRLTRCVITILFKIRQSVLLVDSVVATFSPCDTKSFACKKVIQCVYLNKIFLGIFFGSNFSYLI